MIYKRIISVFVIIMIIIMMVPSANAMNQDDPWSVHEHDYYGYTLWLEGGNEISVYNDRDHFVSGRKVSMLVYNYDIENYGELDLHASVMIKLKDGTVIRSAEVSTSMRSILENLNEHISILSNAQFSALYEMLREHPIIRIWKTDSFYN